VMVTGGLNGCGNNGINNGEMVNRKQDGDKETKHCPNQISQ